MMEQAENTVTGEQRQSEAVLDSLIQDENAGAASGGSEMGGEVANFVPPNTVQNLAGLLTLIGVGFEFKGYMRAASVWSDQACNELAAKLVPVFAKYSWGQRLIAFLNDGGGIEELALFPVALAMITSTYNAYMADKQAEKPVTSTDEMKPGEVYDAGSPLGSTFTTT